jgi:SNF family Na+-dependent transporter
MAAVFFVITAIAGISSVVRYQIVYHSLVDSFPLQFQDDLTSRYAFPVLVLSPSTPLSLQANYLRASWGSCVCCLCVSLDFFFSQNTFGCLVLVGFFWAVFKTIKSWKTYKENSNRVVNQNDWGQS